MDEPSARAPWRPEAVVLCGIQASGKSTFCRERFYDSHLRLNLDMLRTRHRERLLLAAVLEARQPVVVDNTNATRAERARYIEPAWAAGFRVLGYYFRSRPQDALQRNRRRQGRARIPDRGIWGTAGRLELPAWEEGFEELHYVRIAAGAGFVVEPWQQPAP